MRVDHLPNKRDATGAGRYPGPRYGMRGLMSSSYYAREQLAQRGGTREREGRGPQAKGGATLARMARACRTAATPVLCVACVVWWPVVGASPSRTGGRRSRCGATGQRLDPPVVFVSLSGEWGGCRSARAVCAERCWRPGTTRTVAGPTAQDPRMLITTLSSEVRGQRCTRPYPWTVSHRESNFNSFKVAPLPLTPHRLTIALGAGSQRLNSQWAPSSSSPRRHARRGSRQDTMQRPRPRRRRPAPRGDPCPAAPLPLRKGPCALLQLGLLGSR